MGRKVSNFSVYLRAFHSRLSLPGSEDGGENVLLIMNGLKESWKTSTAPFSDIAFAADPFWPPEAAIFPLSFYDASGKKTK